MEFHFPQPGGGGRVVTVADAAARFALTGLDIGTVVYQEDTGFYYQLTSLHTGVLVAGAGTRVASGMYTERGTAVGRPYFNLVGTPDLSWSRSIFWNGTRWMVTDSGASPYYHNDDEDVALPWLSATWVVGDGSSPAPTVTQIVNPEQSPSNWTALPKVCSMNFYVSGGAVVVTREDDHTDTGVDVSYNATGRVLVNSFAPLFGPHTQVWCELAGSASAATSALSVLSDTSMLIYAYSGGSLSDVVYGNGTTSTASLKIEVYPEPD